MKTILEELLDSIDRSINSNIIERKSGETIKWYINTYYIYKEKQFIQSIIDQHDRREDNKVDTK